VQVHWLGDALARHMAERRWRVLGGLATGEEGVRARAQLTARLLDLLAEVDAEAVDLPGDQPHAGREALTWIGPERPVAGEAGAGGEPGGGVRGLRWG